MSSPEAHCLQLGNHAVAVMVHNLTQIPPGIFEHLSDKHLTATAPPVFRDLLTHLGQAQTAALLLEATEESNEQLKGRR